MSTTAVTRRRFLSVLAAGAAASLGPAHSTGSSHVWAGTALGADARIVLSGEGNVAASDAVADCLAEIERLEAIFSLHAADSELARLNANGFSTEASIDLRVVLRHCQTMHAWTQGLFDPTVQPLWEFYAHWFRADPSRSPPPEATVEEMRRTVGFEKVGVHGAEIELVPGCRLTLNGIAQGYITDRIAHRLKELGWTSVLADIGEVIAVGPPPPHPAYTVRIRENDLTLPCADAALATSAASALLFSGDGGFSHIINPRTGLATSPWRCVTVRHASATLADGLSTALTLATETQARRIGARVPAATIWAVRPNGSILHMPA